MYIGDVVREQVDDLIGRVGNARLLHGRRVAAELVHKRLEPLRDVRAGKLQRAVDLIRICDRHDARDHRHRNAGLANLVQEIVQKIIVKEHLRGQKFTAGVNLFLKETNVLFLIRALRMLLRIAGAADAKVRAAFPKLADEVDGVVIRPGFLM